MVIENQFLILHLSSRRVYLGQVVGEKQLIPGFVLSQYWYPRIHFYPVGPPILESCHSFLCLRLPETGSPSYSHALPKSHSTHVRLQEILRDSLKSSGSYAYVQALCIGDYLKPQGKRQKIHPCHCQKEQFIDLFFS